LASLIAFILYPIPFFLIKDPEALKWARDNGFRPMERAFMVSREAYGIKLYFVKFVVVAILLVGWAKTFSISLVSLFYWNNFPKNALLYILLPAVVMVGLRITFFLSVKRVRLPLLDSGLVRGTLSTWIAVIILGALIEETWRSATLVVFLKQGINTGAALVLASVGSTFCRLLGIPSRNPGKAEEVIWEFCLGIALGSLYLFSRTAFVPFAINVVYYTFNSAFLRRKSATLKSIREASSSR